MDNELILTNSVKWWEKRRPIFNLIVGFTGVITLLIVAKFFGKEEFIGLIIYGLVVNLFYSLGILLELFDYYYFNNRIGLKRFRVLFLILGTLISFFITIFNVILYYIPKF